MKPRVVVLGAGFGGLELCTILSEEMGEDLDITLIDKSDSFAFGFSKLDIMFGRTTPECTRLYYRNIVKPGVTSREHLPQGGVYGVPPRSAASPDRSCLH